MPRTIFQIEDGKFALSLTDPGVADVCAATLADFPTDFGCQITSGALSASPSTNTVTVPATWCAPEETIPSPGQTGYSLDLSFLQDPNVMAGLSRFLFEHDTEEAYFFIGMDGDDPPKAMGKVRIVSGTIGGEGRTNLTAQVSMGVVGKPEVCFGDKTASESVGGDLEDITATFDAAVAPTTAASFADLAAIKADGAVGDGGTAWAAGQSLAGFTFASGQYVVLGDGSRAHYSAAAWSAGPAA